MKATIFMCYENGSKPESPAIQIIETVENDGQDFQALLASWANSLAYECETSGNPPKSVTIVFGDVPRSAGEIYWEASYRGEKMATRLDSENDAIKAGKNWLNMNFQPGEKLTFDIVETDGNDTFRHGNIDHIAE